MQGIGHRPKRQKHVSDLIVAIVIPPRRDLKTTNYPNALFFFAGISVINLLIVPC
jgi:hypothetical protein